MTTDELEALLEGGEETPTFDIKAPMNWDAVGMAKDILAMSNVQDGGVILVGVEDKTFKRLGVSDEQQATFVIDVMRDQISPYADPSVSFKVSFPKDRAGLSFVAIEVRPFREIPVICARDGKGLEKGTIYYRSDTRRPQSAKVNNSSDLRDIIELAIARRGQRLSRIGFVAKDSNEADLDDELKGL